MVENRFQLLEQKRGPIYTFRRCKILKQIYFESIMKNDFFQYEGLVTLWWMSGKVSDFCAWSPKFESHIWNNIIDSSPPFAQQERWMLRGFQFESQLNLRIQCWGRCRCMIYSSRFTSPQCRTKVSCLNPSLMSMTSQCEVN